MTPIPADVLLFFFIKMDIELIDTMLDEDEHYLNMNYVDFKKYLTDGFEKHKALGDTDLLALKGKYDTAQKPGYSFMGNKSFERFDLILEVDTENRIVNMLRSDNFQFDDNSFIITNRQIK